MPLDPIFGAMFAPPTEKELTAVRSMQESWRNPELEVIALKVSRLEVPTAHRREMWTVIDLLKEIDGRAVVTPKGEPCSPTSA